MSGFIVAKEGFLVIQEETVSVVMVEGFLGQGPVGPPGQSGAPRVLHVPFASVLLVDWTNADVIRVTLTGDTTITLTGANDGQKCTLELTQDSTGGWVAVFGSEVRYGNELGAISLSPVAGKQSKLGFTYDADAGKYDLVAQLTAF